LKFHHFIDNFNTQSLLHKMNDDNSKKLFDAIIQNDTATASSLISSGYVNLNGEPLPLHFAVDYGRVEIMTMLLDAGADINAVDERRRTACHIAILNDQFDALKLLFERGANLAVFDSRGDSLLSTVAQNDRDERFAISLLDAGAPLDGLSPIHLLGWVKNVAMFNRLMARGVNLITMRDGIGGTLCHFVASNVTSEDDLRFLVNVCGNDAVHAVDNDGDTPLHWASSRGNDSAVRVLVELGAEIDRQDSDGLTALINAAANVQSSCVQLLITLGADVSLVNKQGRAACHIAADWRRPASLCALVAAGGDLDQPDSKGETPRMIAARRNVQLPTAGDVEAARRRFAKTRLDLVRERAFQICLGLHPLDINALQLCEILMHSFGALGSLILFHQWWVIATKVKHFRDHKQRSSTTTTTSATNNETKTQ
jgi:ankyrin repeat protein